MATPSTRWWAVMMRAGALQGSTTVRADSHRARDAATVFIRDGNIIHTFHTADIGGIADFPHQKEAADAVTEHRRALSGGATLRVSETTIATVRGGARRRKGAIDGPPTASGTPAEGLSIRVRES